jgi:hypothetical protein
VQSLFKRVAQTTLAMALSASVSVLAHGAHTGALELDPPSGVPGISGECHQHGDATDALDAYANPVFITIQLQVTPLQ